MALSQLESMGFPTIRCQKALLATGSADAETAMTWLLEHMDDPGDFYDLLRKFGQMLILLPDIDSPIPQAGGSASASSKPTADQICMIADMGFSAAQARKALRESVRVTSTP